jgi:hypothetical protein
MEKGEEIKKQRGRRARGGRGEQQEWSKKNKGKIREGTDRRRRRR